MPDLWFVLGLAIGMVLMGFCAIGSFDRGALGLPSPTPGGLLAVRPGERGTGLAMSRYTGHVGAAD